MMLWIELRAKFERLCRGEEAPVDLLARIWQYAQWCLIHGNPDVSTAAALGFCEHLLDSRECAVVLPTIMKRDDFISIRSLLEYHNSKAEVDSWLQVLWK